MTHDNLWIYPPYINHVCNDLIARILANAIHDGKCLTYRTTTHKYGLVSLTWRGKRMNIPVHRAMYMATNQCLDLPSLARVGHTCGNARCVNIEHIKAPDRLSLLVQ